MKTSPKSRYFLIGLTIIIGLFSFYKLNHWDLYFYHYPKRAMTIRAWQCGYKELADYIKQNYDRYNKFIITDQHGQPYIFLLFYLKYDPMEYQKQARLSSPDKYGFGQVDAFDKFDFNFNLNPNKKKTVYVGYPDGFINNTKIDLSKIKKIKVGTEEIFWIYENP